jgi:hypothetical protein
MRFHFLLGCAVAAAAVAFTACADGDRGDSPDGDGGVAAIGGAVAPNTFMTFNGRDYRLVEVLQANLIKTADFEAIGAATEMDVDADDSTVYRRQGDAQHVYTFTKGTGSGNSATPDTWLQWRLES